MDSTTQHLVFVTGSSRGLGLGIVHALLDQPRTHVIGIARKAPESALSAPTRYEHWSHDLAQSQDAAAALREHLVRLAYTPRGPTPPPALRSVALINNAALLTQPGELEASAADELAAAVRVGLEAPILLTAAFLDATRDWPVRRRVLHISSGLGRRAMAGSAAYCAIKAGLDHLARAQQLDQALRRERGLNPAAVVSLAPGVIDTDMQVALRSADVQRFPERATFAALASGGQLSSADDAGKRIVAFLNHADFGREAAADIRKA